MNFRLEQLFLSAIWILFLALSIPALRIPARPEPREDYRYSAVRANKHFALSPWADLPKTQLEPIDFKNYGAKRTIIRYGPYTVPSMNENNGMKEFNELSAEKPCTDCYITKLQAGLEYPNGSIANSDTGMWLHHAVLYDFGRQDLSCPNLPYRFFASGNERTRLDMTINGTSKTGFPLLGDSNMGITVEFMNELQIPRDTILTFEFEYIPTLNKDFRPLDALWLDITGVCGESEAEIPPDKDVFEYHTPDVKVNSSGQIIAAGGHLHDGGTMVRITLNGKTLCDFPTEYGGSAGYIDAHPMAMPMAMMSGAANASHHVSSKSSPRLHISKMPLCYKAGRFKAGDSFGIIAYYNLTKHEPMFGGKGGLEPVMGISILYLENDLAINPSQQGISVTTAPFTGITITQPPQPTPAPNSTVASGQSPSSPSPITSPSLNVTSIVPAEPTSHSTSVVPGLLSTSLSVLPVTSTVTISRDGITSTITVRTSIVLTIVPPTPTSKAPVTIITPSPPPKPPVSSPNQPASPPISTPRNPPPVTSPPITSPPTITTPSSTKKSGTPWWINVSRSRSGLVPMFTSRSGSWQFTYQPGTKTLITKVTTPAILIPIPIIIPFGPTVVNQGWTITLPLPARTTVVTEYRTRRGVVAPTPEPTAPYCQTGYPCGPRTTYL